PCSSPERWIMRLEGLVRGFVLCVFWVGAAWGQTSSSTARIETVPLHLTMPESYQVTAVLEPARRVTVVAAAGGVVRGLDVRVGGMVREGQDLAQLDRGEANAKLKMALAEVKEKQGLVKGYRDPSTAEIAQAQLEAAEARAELARLELDRYSVRAPFGG